MLQIESRSSRLSPAKVLCNFIKLSHGTSFLRTNFSSDTSKCKCLIKENEIALPPPLSCHLTPIYDPVSGPAVPHYAIAQQALNYVYTQADNQPEPFATLARSLIPRTTGPNERLAGINSITVMQRVGSTRLVVSGQHWASALTLQVGFPGPNIDEPDSDLNLAGYSALKAGHIAFSKK